MEDQVKQVQVQHNQKLLWKSPTSTFQHFNTLKPSFSIKNKTHKKVTYQKIKMVLI